MKWDFYLDSHTLDTLPRLSNDKSIMLSLRESRSDSWQSIFYDLYCFGDSLKSPRNDGKVERFYFLRKQNDKNF